MPRKPAVDPLAELVQRMGQLETLLLRVATVPEAPEAPEKRRSNGKRNGKPNGKPNGKRRTFTAQDRAAYGAECQRRRDAALAVFRVPREISSDPAYDLRRNGFGAYKGAWLAPSLATIKSLPGIHRDKGQHGEYWAINPKNGE